MIRVLIYSLILLYSFNLYAQRDKKTFPIKKIVRTETYISNSEDIKEYKIFYTLETDYNLEQKKLFDKQVRYYKGEATETQIKYIYNNKNKIKLKEHLILKDSINYTESYSYTKDTLIKKKYYEYKLNNTIISNKELIEYDEKNRLKTVNLIYTETRLDTGEQLKYVDVIYSYNKKRQNIKTDFSNSNASYRRDIIYNYYNQKGRVKKRKVYNEHNKLLKTNTFKYKNNEKQHWILKQMYTNNKLDEVIYRDITYY